jgi:hypothetical protein
MGFFTPYIEEEEWKENIKKYKYRGNDKSIFYRYVTSPLCNELVKYVPNYIA